VLRAMLPVRAGQLQHHVLELHSAHQQHVHPSAAACWIR
jgi:hypothetical protein